MQQARSQSVAKRNSNKCSQRGPSSGYNNNNNKLALNLLSQLSLKSKGGLGETHQSRVKAKPVYGLDHRHTSMCAQTSHSSLSRNEPCGRLQQSPISQFVSRWLLPWSHMCFDHRFRLYFHQPWLNLKVDTLVGFAGTRIPQ